jgi:hypothetical protein
MERQAKDGTIYQMVGEDQWTPVTRQAKDGTVYRKVGADKWAQLEDPKPKPKEASTQGQAALEGFGQGASFGYLPQLQAAAAPLQDAILAKVASTDLGADLLGVPKGAKPEDSTYVERRDENIKRQQKLADKNPLTYGGSALAGGLTTGIATAGMMPSAGAATAAGRIRNAAKAGTIYGAAMNPGDVEGEINLTQIPERIDGAGKGMVIGVALGAGFEGAAKGLQSGARGLEKTASKFKKWIIEEKPDAKEIEAAAKALGFKPTAGMTTDSQVVQNLESSLSQSPSIPGMLVRGQQKKVAEGLAKGAQSLTDDASQLTKFEAGEQAKKQITENVDKRFQPSKDAFNDLRKYTKDIPSTERSVKAVSNNINKIDEVATFTDGTAAGIAKSVNKALEKTPSADMIKRLRTMVGNRAKEAERAADGDTNAIWQIYHKLGRLEENTIKRGVIESGKFMDGAQDATDVYHATFNKFKPEDIKPSTKGKFGEGYYVSTDKADVGNYGDLVHNYKLTNKKIFDTSKDPEKLKPVIEKLAKKYDLDISGFDPSSKYNRDGYYQLVQAIRDKYGLVGTDGNAKLTEILKKEGYAALRFNQNGSRGNLVVFDRANIKTPSEFGKPSETANNISKGMLGQLKSAKKGYSEQMGKIQEVGQATNIKATKSPKFFNEAIDEMQAEKVADKFFNLGNAGAREKAKEVFPEAFQTLRKQRLSEIRDKAMTKGALDPSKLVRQVDKLDDEALRDLFRESVSTSKNMKKVMDSFPAKVGPSGTPQGLMYSNIFDLAQRQVTDFGRYGAYKFLSSPTTRAIGKNLQRLPEFKSLAETKPEVFNMVVGNFARALENPSSVMPKVAEEKPKGEKKWAADGFDKLVEHSGPEIRQTLEKMRNAMLKDQKLKVLLIKASDMNPGSKAMDQILDEIMAKKKQSLATGVE